MAEASKSKTTVTVIAVVASLLLVGYLVRQMARYTKPAPVGVERAAARAKDSKDIRSAGAAALNNYGYVDAAKGVARLPIAEGMKLTVQGYKNADAFHKDLVARSEKATAPAPKAPEKPSEYE